MEKGKKIKRTNIWLIFNITFKKTMNTLLLARITVCQNNNFVLMT